MDHTGAIVATTHGGPAGQAPLGAACVRAAALTAAGFVWVTLFWFQPAESWPYRRAVDEFASLVLVDTAGLDVMWAWSVRSWTFVGIPLLLLRLAGRPFDDLGLGGTSGPHDWRIVAAGVLVSAPVILALGMRSGVQHYYRGFFTPDVWRLAAVYATVTVAEHVWIPGVMLALMLPCGRLPPRQPGPPRRGPLGGLGFGASPGGSGVSDWLGVPVYAWPALLGQALIFGSIHASKDPGEFLSAFPGGLALGVVSLRLRSIWPALVLHAGVSTLIVLVAGAARLR
ncbi:MAG: CPBP family intramembrane glutamic endopeptidase [Vicinamibacterales bacterium]